jgi:hypothetical protein
MIKDIIADHFSGNPQAGCRVIYPISRLYVQVNHLRFTGQLRFPMSRAIACHSWRNGEAARNREVLLTPKLLETLRD